MFYAICPKDDPPDYVIYDLPNITILVYKTDQLLKLLTMKIREYFNIFSRNSRFCKSLFFSHTADGSKYILLFLNRQSSIVP